MIYNVANLLKVKNSIGGDRKKYIFRYYFIKYGAKAYKRVFFMIDLILLRENSDFFRIALKKKDPNYNIEQLIKLDKEIRRIRSEVELLRAQRNELAKQGRSGITTTLREQSLFISEQLKIQE